MHGTELSNVFRSLHESIWLDHLLYLSKATKASQPGLHLLDLLQLCYTINAGGKPEDNYTRSCRRAAWKEIE